ncbi:unnamed protein product [Discosporangium mesarthrocarpum]
MRQDYQLFADLPGVKKEDISLDIDSETHRLNLSAEKKRERTEESKSEEGGARYHFVERSYGKLSRSIRLPENMDIENADANYSNGVLHLSFPKKEVPAPRKIPIKFNDEQGKIKKSK